MAQGKKLKLGLYTNGVDYVIATSVGEARRICMKECGIDPDQMGTFELYPAKKLFSLYPDPDGVPEVKTARAWVKSRGRKGYFACTEL